ncbi:VWA domain-containing protein [Candidatus Poribacteria bacterium]|nr:VWA domain-containing protein [Candidatus Poribacteria bacterium]
MGFLNPFLLFGALTAAVPLLIHLWSRRQAATVEFSTLRFLLEAHRKTVRRLQLEQWLLLALRALVLVLAALALARPILHAGGWLATTRDPAAVAIVLDVSGSMSYQGATGVRMELARQRADDIVRSLETGDEVALILMSDSADSLFEPPTTELADVRQAIRSTEVTARSTRPEASIELALSLLDRSSLRHRELYIVSDFAQTGWDSLALDTQDVKTYLVHVGDAETANASIVSVELSAPQPVVNLPSKIAVKVRNWGDAAFSDRTLELLVDDEVRASRVVRLPPRSEIVEHVSHTFDAAGTHRIVARLAEDRLSSDDTRSATASVQGDLDVLVTGSGELYMALALDPERLQSVEGGAAIRPSTAPSSAFAQLDLSARDAVVLVDPTLSDSRDVDRIRSYLMAGGTCIVYLGPSASPAAVGAAPWMPVESEGITRYTPPTKLSLGASPQGTGLTSAAHPLAVFEPQSWLRRTSPDFQAAHRLGARDGSDVLASFADGNPAIVASQFGSGRVIAVNTPATGREWSNLPVTPFFVPLVQQLVFHGTRDLSRPKSSLEVGDVYTRQMGATDPVTVAVTTPRGDTRTIPRSEDGASISFADTGDPGMYRLGPGSGGKASAFAEWFTVAFPADESDLSPASREMVAAALRGGATWLDATTDGVDPDVSAILRERRSGRELWRPLIFAALALLLIESLVSHRIESRKDNLPSSPAPARGA